MCRNELADDNVSSVLVAGLACLASVPILYLGTRPLVWLMHSPWLPWLLAGLFIAVPVLVAFIVLYWSAWHEERPRPLRIFSAAMSSCIIFGVDVFAVGVLVAIGCIILGLSRVMGGN